MLEITLYFTNPLPPNTISGLEEATKCSDHRTISLIAHTAKIVSKLLRRRIEKKIEVALGEDQFGFRRGKVTRDAENNIKTNLGDR